VRDGAAARAASDYLHTYRAGKVSATLNILSIDLESRTLVVTRNNPVPVILLQEGRLKVLGEPSEPVGSRRGVRPVITEVPLSRGLAALVFTDGLIHAGERKGDALDVEASVRTLMLEGPPDPARWAERLLAEAIEHDDGRACDDISLVVAAILPRKPEEARRLIVRMPL
jgi:serine phosphatase RsbU (regulator of sigma subunit)